jgi:hypothetical protein
MVGSGSKDVNDCVAVDGKVVPVYVVRTEELEDNAEVTDVTTEPTPSMIAK